MNGAARVVLTSLLVLGCAQESPPVESTAAETPPSPTDRIGLAMSAGPASITINATIMDYDASGSLVEIRPGTNGWMCLADSTPAAPERAPICVDETWQQWFDAYMKKEPPRITRVGISYMLKGGPTASNTDPYAEMPAAGENWVEDGPHMMIVVPDLALLEGYSTNHSTGAPYVMWKGTPYAHLMVPISPHENN